MQYFENHRNIYLRNRKHFDKARNMKIDSQNDLDLTLAASAFAALGSEQRLSVLRALVRAGSEGLSIGELGARTGVTGSTLTHHVKLLAQAGLVQQERKGRSIISSAVAYDEVKALSDFLLNECCADSSAPNKDHFHG